MGVKGSNEFQGFKFLSEEVIKPRNCSDCENLYNKWVDEVPGSTKSHCGVFDCEVPEDVIADSKACYAFEAMD